jgi:TolB protein
VRLTNYQGPYLLSYMPAWAPDGHRIAFVSNREGNTEIYVLTVDGPIRPPARLTNNVADDTNPFWSPLP